MLVTCPTLATYRKRRRGSPYPWQSRKLPYFFSKLEERISQHMKKTPHENSSSNTHGLTETMAQAFLQRPLWLRAAGSARGPPHQQLPLQLLDPRLELLPDERLRAGVHGLLARAEPSSATATVPQPQRRTVAALRRYTHGPGSEGPKGLGFDEERAWTNSASTS